MQAQSHRFTHTITTVLPYLVYLPDDYTTSGQDYPLILFLHGSGERGTTLDAVKQIGLPKKLESGFDIPCVVIAPQCPPNTNWEYHLESLKSLIDTACESYRIDHKRIYLTGLSMGGAGTWSLATEYPDLFAAALPICGRNRRELNYPERLQSITHLPLWCFHGDADPVVPVESSIYLTDNMKTYGGDPKLTIYEGVDHDSWTQTYDNPEIYDWLLSHQIEINN